MSQCPFHDELGAYRDGELPQQHRAEVREHLDGCAACAAEVAELDAVSRWLAQSPQPRLSQISLHRLHERIDRAVDQDLMRMVRTLGAIAASILLLASVWLAVQKYNPPIESAPAPLPWTDATTAAEVDSPVRYAATPAAQFYLADSSQLVEP